MRSRISIIATVLSLIFAICLWNIIEMGGLYIFDNYYIVHNLDGWRSLPFDNKVYRSDIADFLSTNIRKLVFPFCKLYRYDLIKNHKIYRFTTLQS